MNLAMNSFFFNFSTNTKSFDEIHNLNFAKFLKTSQISKFIEFLTSYNSKFKITSQTSQKYKFTILMHVTLFTLYLVSKFEVDYCSTSLHINSINLDLPLLKLSLLQRAPHCNLICLCCILRK